MMPETSRATWSTPLTASSERTGMAEVHDEAMEHAGHQVRCAQACVYLCKGCRSCVKRWFKLD